MGAPFFVLNNSKGRYSIGAAMVIQSNVLVRSQVSGWLRETRGDGPLLAQSFIVLRLMGCALVMPSLNAFLFVYLGKFLLVVPLAPQAFYRGMMASTESRHNVDEQTS